MSKTLFKAVIARVPFTKLNRKELIEYLQQKIDNTKDMPQQLVFANAYSVVLANQNKDFMNVCNSKTIVIPDGQSIIWTSRLNRQTSLSERIAGPDFMINMFELSERNGYKNYFLCSDSNTEQLLREKLTKEYPKLKISGTHTLPFGNWDISQNNTIVERINHAKPDLLWVGISSPKQDLWLYNNLSTIDAKILVGVGAAFNFYTNQVTRAPKFMQKTGMEWFYRLIKEPRRLWKRYLIGNILFIWYAFTYWFKNND